MACPQVVIVVEGTRSTSFILGIIVAVVCSNWVAKLVHSEGVYESDLEWDGSVFFLRPDPPQRLRKLRCKDVSWHWRCHMTIKPDDELLTGVLRPRPTARQHNLNAKKSVETGEWPSLGGCATCLWCAA